MIKKAKILDVGAVWPHIVPRGLSVRRVVCPGDPYSFRPVGTGLTAGEATQRAMLEARALRDWGAAWTGSVEVDVDREQSAHHLKEILLPRSRWSSYVKKGQAGQRWLHGRTPAGFVRGVQLGSWKEVYVPAQLVGDPPYTVAGEPRVVVESDNGLAWRPTFESAALVGLMEIIERDRAARWWLGWLCGRKIATKAAEVLRVKELLAQQGVSVILVRIEPGGMPAEVVTAALVDPQGHPEVALGLGAHVTLEGAAYHAVLEAVGSYVGIRWYQLMGRQIPGWWPKREEVYARVSGLREERVEESGRRVGEDEIWRWSELHEAVAIGLGGGGGKGDTVRVVVPGLLGQALWSMLGLEQSRPSV